MSIVFPTGLDNFTNNTTDDYVIAQDINDLNDSVEALETKVGVDNSAVSTSIDYILKNKIWPIGSIYINAGVATNPATLLGFGTWTAFGAGKMIIGIDSTDADFDSLTDTGGSKTSTALIAHTHTGPSHTHTGPSHTHTGPSHTHTGTSGNESADHTHTGTTGGRSADHTHTINKRTGTSVQSGINYAESDGVFNRDFSSGGASADHTHSFTSAGRSAAHTHSFTSAAAGTGNTGAGGTGATGADGTGATGSSGSGASYSIMNPFVTAYMWKRTA